MATTISLLHQLLGVIWEKGAFLRAMPIRTLYELQTDEMFYRPIFPPPSLQTCIDSNLLRGVPLA